LYNVQPGSGMGLFSQPWSPQGAVDATGAFMRIKKYELLTSDS